MLGNMLKIGITGTIGSGKSTVAAIFAALGIPVYDSDANAKRLMKDELRAELTTVVGGDLFRDGVIDKKYLASRLFSEPELKLRVENVVHPAVAADFLRWVDRQHAPYVILESALLFSSVALGGIVDRTVVVSCPRGEATLRAMRRDNSSREAVERRMDSQMSLEQMLQKADYQITNGKNELLTPKVVALSDIFTNFAAEF